MGEGGGSFVPFLWRVPFLDGFFREAKGGLEAMLRHTVILNPLFVWPDPPACLFEFSERGLRMAS